MTPLLDIPFADPKAFHRRNSVRWHGIAGLSQLLSEDKKGWCHVLGRPYYYPKWQGQYYLVGWNPLIGNDLMEGREDQIVLLFEKKDGETAWEHFPIWPEDRAQTAIHPILLKAIPGSDSEE